METAAETREETQHAADLREALRVAGERLAEMADAYEEAEPDWIKQAFDVEVRLGLARLRSYIEDPAQAGVSWDVPFLELAYPVEWDFENQRLLYGTFGPEDVVDGEVSEEKIFEVLFEARQRIALSRLTRAVVEWHEDGKAFYLLPQDVADALDEVTGTKALGRGEVEGPAEAVEARRKLVESMAGPFEMGEFLAESFEAYRRANPGGELDDNAERRLLELVRRLEKRPDLPPRPFTAKAESGEVLEGSVVALAYPLLVAATARRAWFTLGVGLVFTQGDPLQFPEEALNALWADLTRIEEPAAARSTKAEPKAGPATPQTERYLLTGATLMDRKAAHLVGFMDGTALPRKWGRIRKWEDIVREEKNRILEELGREAFLEAPDRRPMLRRRLKASGEEVLELTREAEESLREREGYKGFRETRRDRDGVNRECLVKHFRAGGSAGLTVSLSWYGRAWPLVSEALEEEERRLRRFKADKSNLLFDEMRDEDQRRADEGLALLGTLKDARSVMDYVLRKFGHQGENPLRVPARELRMLLGCEEAEKGHSRVEAALRALQEVRFNVKASGSGYAFGAFLDTVRYEGRGAGKHTDGDFYLSLAEYAIGCLKVFARGSYLKDARRVFDWSAKLDKEARRGELDYLQGFSTLTPFYDRLKGFTPSQSRLLKWLEQNVTLQRDATAKWGAPERISGRTAEADRRRVYTPAFCPLLEPERRYNAALGHFKNNPERGFKLKGRAQPQTKTGGARRGGILEAMGYDLPRGRASVGRSKVAEMALKDLRAVVEEALGGVAAGKYKGQWLNMEAAAKLRVSELLEGVSWFLFLPEEWLDRMHRDIEARHLVRVTTDRSTYEDSLEDRTGATTGIGLAELRQRLHAARKERGLSQAVAGEIFGVSQSAVAAWERGPEKRGKSIPADVQPLVLRWIETGEAPSADELKAMAPRRKRGRN